MAVGDGGEVAVVVEVEVDEVVVVEGMVGASRVKRERCAVAVGLSA